jgi:hypothetical protein
MTRIKVQHHPEDARRRRLARRVHALQRERGEHRQGDDGVARRIARRFERGPEHRGALAADDPRQQHREQQMREQAHRNRGQEQPGAKPGRHLRKLHWGYDRLCTRAISANIAGLAEVASRRNSPMQSDSKQMLLHAPDFAVADGARIRSSCSTLRAVEPLPPARRGSE